MTSLLDCADEIILLIVSSLQTLHEKDQTPAYDPSLADWDEYFIEWPTVCDKEDINHSHLMSDLHSLILTSRRLARLVQPLLYNHIVLPKRNGVHRSAALTRSLANDTSLGNHIYTVSMSNLGADFSLEVFKLPNIHTLTISDWAGREIWIRGGLREAMYDSLRDYPRFSSAVKDLRLRNCEFTEGLLDSLFCLPSALESASFELNAEGLNYVYSDWDGSGFFNAIQFQRDTIRSLKFTIMAFSADQCVRSICKVHLNDCDMLKEVIVSDMFVFYDWEVEKRLPKGLEVLVVHCDESEPDFLEDAAKMEDVLILLNRVPQWKAEFLPMLKAVRVRVDQYRSRKDSSQLGNRGKTYWTPPVEIMRAFESVDIELSVIFKDVVGSGD